MTISSPLLTLEAPKSGWWPMHIDWQGERYSEYPSSVLRDSFIEMIVWLEAILMDALPAVWQIDSEEIQWPILAEKVGPETIRLTLYGKASGAGFRFSLDERSEYPVLASGIVNALQMVSAWYESFIQTINNEDIFVVDEWYADLRQLDTSRLLALLAGQPIEDTWRSDYIDARTRDDRFVKLWKPLI